MRLSTKIFYSLKFSRKYFQERIRKTWKNIQSPPLRSIKPPVERPILKRGKGRFMSSYRDPDSLPRSERTPYNIRADYHETDLRFRQRLEALVPGGLSDRVREVIANRFAERNGKAKKEG